MLGNKEAAATVAVRDLRVTAKFYEETLGLRRIRSEDDVVMFATGKSTLLVYESQYAGTNQATSVSWLVGEELETIVRTLRSRGVEFEHYELPDTELQGDLHVAGKRMCAWFKDPDGNIHALTNS